MNQWLDSQLATGVRWHKLLFTYIDMCIGCMVDSVIYGVRMNDDTYWCLETSLYRCILRRNE